MKTGIISMAFMCALGLISTPANAEKCRVSRGLGLPGSYDVECGREKSAMSSMIEATSSTPSPLQTLNQIRRQNARDDMLYQQHQTEQQLLQLQIQKQQLELERARSAQPKNKRVTVSDYCGFVAKEAKQVAERRDNQSWETLERMLLDFLRDKPLSAVMKHNLIETLNATYYSERTPTDAFYDAEKTCLGQMAKLAQQH